MANVLVSQSFWRAQLCCAAVILASWTYHATRAEAEDVAGDLLMSEPYTIIRIDMPVTPNKPPITDTIIHAMRRGDAAALADAIDNATSTPRHYNTVAPPTLI